MLLCPSGISFLGIRGNSSPRDRILELLSAQRAIYIWYAFAVSKITACTVDIALIANRPIIYGRAVQCQQTLGFPVR